MRSWIRAAKKDSNPFSNSPVLADARYMMRHAVADILESNSVGEWFVMFQGKGAMKEPVVAYEIRRTKAGTFTVKDVLAFNLENKTTAPVT